MFLGGKTLPGGVPGWRVAVLSVGTASAGIGLLSWVFVRDPHYRADGRRQGALPPATAAAMWCQLVAVLRVPTFAIIVVQV